MSDRKHNFNPGPGALPLEVLEEAQRNLVNHQFEGKALGLSVMEMSHRSKEFEAILADAKAAIAGLYGLPASYDVLFLQGGASLQFAMVPMNLGAGGAYVNTGAWSQKAIEEAQRVGTCREIWSDAERNFKGVPAKGSRLEVPADAPYVHITSNNTIFGTQWHHTPEVQKPLVCDMSSDFLSRPTPMEKYDLVYAGAQKNAGPSGVTIVIGKKALLNEFKGRADVPTMLRYATHGKNDSLYNTPPTFGIYLVGLVAHWVERQGGLEAMARINADKAKRLYDVIDKRSDLFEGHADVEARSHMNVTFRLRDDARTEPLLKAASAAGVIGLKGHRSVGGLRASIYNAVSRESVEVLAKLLEKF